MALDPDPAGLLPLSPQIFHILVALAGRDQHGYGIMQDVTARTGGKVRLSAGTLYGLIKRMLEQGLIVELRDSQKPDESLAGGSSDERRRYYRLTPFGRRVLAADLGHAVDFRIRGAPAVDTVTAAAHLRLALTSDRVAGRRSLGPGKCGQREEREGGNGWNERHRVLGC